MKNESGNEYSVVNIASGHFLFKPTRSHFHSTVMRKPLDYVCRQRRKRILWISTQRKAMGTDEKIWKQENMKHELLIRLQCKASTFIPYNLPQRSFSHLSVHEFTSKSWFKMMSTSVTPTYLIQRHNDAFVSYSLKTTKFISLKKKLWIIICLSIIQFLSLIVNNC